MGLQPIHPSDVLRYAHLLKPHWFGRTRIWRAKILQSVPHLLFNSSTNRKKSGAVYWHKYLEICAVHQTVKMNPYAVFWGVPVCDALTQRSTKLIRSTQMVFEVAVVIAILFNVFRRPRNFGENKIIRLWRDGFFHFVGLVCEYCCFNCSPTTNLLSSIAVNEHSLHRIRTNFHGTYWSLVSYPTGSPMIGF
jgi:hypothetical protein